MPNIEYVKSISPAFNAMSELSGGGLRGVGLGTRQTDIQPSVKGAYYPQTERLVRLPWYKGGGTELVPISAEEQAAHFLDWQNRNPDAYFNTGGNVGFRSAPMQQPAPLATQQVRTPNLQHWAPPTPVASQTSVAAPVKPNYDMYNTAAAAEAAAEAGGGGGGGGGK